MGADTMGKHVGCTYCTDTATGIDEDGALTCGAACCMPVVKPLPAVIEVSDEDEDECGGYEHTPECERAARYYAAIAEGAREGDEDDARTLPLAHRALNRARETCGC